MLILLLVLIYLYIFIYIGDMDCTILPTVWNDNILLLLLLLMVVNVFNSFYLFNGKGA